MNASLVYVAGPYSKPDPCENTHNAVAMANEIMAEYGDVLVPVIPHLSHFWHTMTPKPYAEWLRIDLAVMLRCDVIYRMAGDSSGADAEVEVALAVGIPVVYDMEALGAWAAFFAGCDQ